MEYIGGFICVVVFGWGVLFGFKTILEKGYLTSGFLGMGVLCGISTVFNGVSAIIGINIFTLLFSFLLGVPGVIGLLVLTMMIVI